MSLVSFMSESMSAEQSSLMFNPLSNIVRNIIADANGAMLDPSDMATMFQDAAGTTPVTAVEQPVGLMLDKSKGLQLGPELISDSAFDTGINGWTAQYGSVISWESGELKLTGTTTGTQRFSKPISCNVGAFYIVTASVRQGSTISGLLMSVSTNSNLNSAIASSAPVSTTNKMTVQFVFRATATTMYVGGNDPASQVGYTSYYDNISVRELKGNHATQAVTASRPVLSARKNLLLATETLATQSVASIAAQHTLSFTGTGSVTLSGTATGTLTGTGVNDRVSLTVTPTAGTLTLTVSGNVTKAQLELGTVAGPYQRVNTATDYDTDERYFPKYLRFDGIDDYLNLPYMGLYAGGSASIITGRDALSQATDTYIISERSTTDADPKYYPSRQLASGGNMDAYITDDAGAVVLDTTGSVFGGAFNAVIRSVVDAGNNIKLFKNGAVAASDNYARAGTLTLNTTTIGASVSTTKSNYAKMKLYGLLITKSALSDAQRIQCERLLARKSGVIL